MLTFIVVGTAAAVAVILFASILTRNATRREQGYAASGDGGSMPWIDSGSSSDCASGSSDGGCGNGGGGGGD